MHLEPMSSSCHSSFARLFGHHTWLALLPVVLSLSSCSDGQAGDGVRVDAGRGASDTKELAAVGFIRKTPRDAGAATLHCTGTLVAPDKVLTAKHCVSKLHVGDSLVFALGPETHQADREVAIVDANLLFRSPYTFDPRGSDIAVLTLAEPIVDVAPVPVARPGGLAVGETLLFAGYGDDPSIRGSGGEVLDAGAYSGSRPLHSREVTVSLLEGNPYDVLFGNERGYLLEAATYFPGLSEEALREQYSKAPLSPAYEAFAGTRPGDARTCYGDSGGPVFARVDGALQIVGVVSAGVDAGCKLGDLFALFGPDALDLLPASTQKGHDVCSGESEAGRCADTFAIGCVANQGPRHLLTVDCAALSPSKLCGQDSKGRIACL